MEKINLSFKALLKGAAIAVIILLLSSTAWSKSLRESEPNDAIEKANELRPDQSIQGLFQIEDDEDWYKMEISAKDKAIVDVELTEVPGIDSILDIYDADGESLKYSNMGDEGETEAIFRFGVVKGVYYIRAYAYNGENTKNEYTLSVKMISPWKEGQEFEPNDKQEHANELKLDRKVTGYIYPEDDIDWYEIRVDAKGKNILRIDLSSVPNVNSIVRICDKDGEWLKSFDVGDMGKPETVVNFGVTEGTYYIRVEAYDGENKKDKYTLSASLGGPWKEGQEWELNDEIEDANRVKLNKEVTGYLHPEGDADLYALTIPEPDMDVLLIELSAIPEVNSYIELLNADGEELKRADIGEEDNKETLVRMRVAPGEYYVRIYSDDANPEEIYKLRIGKWAKPPATPAEIHEALEKALDYLASSQDEQGCWRLGHYKESTGIAGLCLMAFVGSESLQKKYDPNIRATIKFIKTKYHPSSDYEPNSKDWAREGGLIYQFGGGYAPP